MFRFLGFIPLILLCANQSVFGEDGTKIFLNGSGWYQFGKIMHSTDTVERALNLNDNWSQNSGAQFTVTADIDDHWQGAMGLGGLQFHNTQGRPTENKNLIPGFSPYITQARFSYTMGEPGQVTPLLAQVGLFPYQYNSDTRNLGAYLFRGPVYPGVLISEFESKSLDTTVGNLLGLQLRNNIGAMFTHDLILRSETDLPPVFDVSLAYVASLHVGGIFEIGAGVNFYRLLATNSKVTDLTDRAAFPITPLTSTQHPYESEYAYIDPVNGDTTLLTHRGTKLMARMAFDPKPLFNAEMFGSRDLRLYAEVAVVGTKDYKGIYPDIMQRIPFMVGFNLPTFHFLDDAAFEIEWYGAPFRDDYQRIYTSNSPAPANNGPTSYGREDSSGFILGSGGIPFKDPYDVTNMRKDNLKWSFYMSKTVANCLKLSYQVANDHFRPNTQYNSDPFTYRMQSSSTTLKDWYMMLRLGFFF